ncbi:MAG: alkaline ceramidase [Proteobacteria bacterium]|nr:alkaline ceramidase [Pseudomonadota bacterium]
MAQASKKRSLTVSIRKKKALDSVGSDILLAGSAKVDITPPIGIPMAGYATMSTDSIGVRTKLMARVFYIKPKSGPSVALIQCDLLSGSLILHHRVAELIAAEIDVEIGGLLMAGTHTHSGPGNFFGSMFYNNMAANRAGFDPTLFDFLSWRMASAVIEAYTNRRAARIATGTTTVGGVARNRSLPAYHLNKNIAVLEKAPDINEAVSPYLHLIRVDCREEDGSYKPLGAFSSFSLHPNTNPAELGGVYSGDVFGYAERELEWRIKQRYHTSWEPVHALANHTHGDNNPDYSQTVPENFEDLRKFGVRIADAAFGLFESLDDRLKDDVAVGYRAKEIDVFEENEIDGIKIADRPAVGMSTLAGAQGRGRTTVLANLPLFAPGWPKRFFTRGEQGHKRRIAGPLQSLILPRDEFPHILFLQAVQVDDTVLLPLPFEVTYEMGNRIAAHAGNRGKNVGLDGIARYVVTGTSNGYWGYVTTPEEYSLQYYEGGSNFYGPNTGEFLAAHTGRLVEQLATEGSGAVLPETWEFKMVARDFVPKDSVSAGIRKAAGNPTYHEEAGRNDAYWSFQWYDDPSPIFEMHNDLACVEVQSNDESWEPLVVDGRPVDDSGFDISVLCMEKATKDNTGLYETRWHAPNPHDDAVYRFKILARKESECLYSSPFGIKCTSTSGNVIYQRH